MSFQVPQFIEREPKVIGPFTFRQFVYLAIPGAIAFFLYFTLPFTFFVGGAMALLGLGFVLAFVRSGAKSLPALLMDFLHFKTSPRTYIWKKGVSFRAPQADELYKRTSEQEVLAKQVHFRKESAVQKLGTQIQTQV